MPVAEFGPHASPVKHRDAFRDTTHVHITDGENVWVKTRTVEDTTLMGFTPKQARKLAKTLKRAAKAADRL